MSGVQAGAIVVASLLAVSDVSAQRAAAPPPAGAPPRLLNIVRVKTKPRKAPAYAALEAQIVRAYDRAKVRLYWICLQAPRDSSDILYLNLFPSQEAFDHAPAIYSEAVKQHPDLAPLQPRLRDLTASSTSTLTTRRDDVDRPPAGVDFATMRNLRMTIFQVQPGREGDFLNAIRTTNAKEGSWLVYEANDTSTYALITLKRTSIGRRDGPAIPRALRRFKGVYTSAETKVYAVRPALSHVSPAFIAANPQLWKPAPAVTH